MAKVEVENENKSLSLLVRKFIMCTFVMRNEIFRDLKQKGEKMKNLSSFNLILHSTAISSIKLKKYSLKFQDIFTHIRRLLCSLIKAKKNNSRKAKNDNDKNDENFFFISDSISSHLRAYFISSLILLLNVLI